MTEARVNPLKRSGQAAATALAHPGDLITMAAMRFGSGPAFTVILPDGGSRSLSFEETDRLSTAFAGFLATALEVSPGDVLAVQLVNGLPFPIAVFGAWKAGLIVTPVNPFYTAVETRRQLLDSGAKAIVAGSAALDLLADEVDMPGLAMVAVDGPGLEPSTQEGADGEWATEREETGSARFGFADALTFAGSTIRFRHPTALYQYTGGTTGRSKAAIITAANLLATKAMVARFFSDNGAPIAGGTALTALPLYHIFAFLFGMLVYVDAGTHDVLIPVTRPVSTLRPAFEQHAVDWMAGVDTLYAGLLAEEWFRAHPPRLRFAIAGGAALKPSVALDWEEQVGPILEGYGLTETTGIVSCNPPTNNRRVGSVGLPVSESEVRIVDHVGNDVSPGTAGELLVRGPQVVNGYMGDPDTDAFAAGWFKTGDVVVQDSFGMLTIMDRKKDMILVSGFNVFPTEVEAVLSTHPSVVEAAVVGVANDRTSEAVQAFVVVRDPPPPSGELDRHCRLALAAYKVPRKFVVIEQLPKSAVGKVLRAELRQRATGVRVTA